MISDHLPSESIENRNELIPNIEIEQQEVVIETSHKEERTVEELMAEMEKLVNYENAGEEYKIFNQLKGLALAKINEETEDKKYEYDEKGFIEPFDWEHPFLSKMNGLVNIFKEKYDIFIRNQEEEYKNNLENRKEIIEKLKNLYTNPEPGVNLFKAIREIKELWANAGKVAKSQFKLLNNDYFHHLNQFYLMLDMDKEFLEQEYSHNLEKRQHIINRAKELEQEPIIQKALNELQYLHKLWKEEAEPVAEEFREKTWEEFKEISNRIHYRKTELSAQIEIEQNANLERKNAIISEIKALTIYNEGNLHSHWQKAIKQVEVLREEFLKLGSVPRKLSNQNWVDFKQTLREFNSAKNDFYRSMKGDQMNNLQRKQELIQTAVDNMMSEDWEMAVPLFKKLQEEWKSIGHVPKSQANRVWNEFREACNTFFDNYRKQSDVQKDNWRDNYKQKKVLLEELKSIESEGVEKIEEIQTKWNAIGKVPKNKMAINTEFNKTLKEKLKINNLTEFDLRSDNLTESQITDRARKLKNQIADLEIEITNLENNLGFFSNPTRENPLLKGVFSKIDEKKSELETLRKLFHQMISGK